MKKINYFTLTIFFCLLVTLLCACSALSGQTATEEGETTPTPIALPTQLSVLTRVESQTCLILETAAIQTDELQGDLMAWSPVSDQLALVQPVNQYSGWYVGNILVYDAKEKGEVAISENAAVFGDLAWSPDGQNLAYVALDQQEGIYTIKIWTLTDVFEKDLFGDIESARTNDYSSAKGIRGWAPEQNLTVVSSCGVDCVRVYEYNPVSLSLIVQGEVRQNEDTSLVLQNEMTSPDGKWSIYVDDDDDLWLTAVQTNVVSLLLPRIEMIEAKWSADSHYLALRTADQVKVYELGCTP